MTQADGRHAPRPWISTSILMIVGFLVFLYVLFQGVVDSHSTYHSFTAPGIKEIELTSPGEYMIFHEYDRTVDSRGILKPSGFEQLVMMLRDKESGAGIALEKTTTPIRTNIRRIYREARYSFNIDAPTTVILEADYNEAGNTQEFQVSVGRFLQGSLIMGVVKATGIILLFGLVIAAIWVKAIKGSHVAATT